MNEQELAAKAVEYLVSSAAEYAAAQAELTRADLVRKTTLAIEMKGSGEKSAAAQEREALASDGYAKAIDTVVEATRVVCEFKAKREAASASIEYWRSLNANQRRAERGM